MREVLALPAKHRLAVITSSESRLDASLDLHSFGSFLLSNLIPRTNFGLGVDWYIRVNYCFVSVTSELGRIRFADLLSQFEVVLITKQSRWQPFRTSGAF